MEVTTTKVAVLGGGCAAITTAFELSRPEHEGRYEVTVYQQGWRLGGKGASGRGVADRIEEHGLHIWLGFYENAFRIMRECYAELGRDSVSCPISTWQEAFVPEPQVGVAEWSREEGWQPWTAAFPAMPGLPGDPLNRDNPFTISGYMMRLVQCLRALFRAAVAEPPSSSAPQAVHTSPPNRPDAPEHNELDGLMESVARLLNYGKLATMGLVLEALRTVELVLSMLVPFPTKPVFRSTGSTRNGNGGTS